MTRFLREFGKYYAMSWTVAEPILVPVDFSGMSVAAISAIANRVEQVFAVHVVPNLDHIAPGTTDLELGTDEERHVGVRAHFGKYLAEHGFSDVQPIILNGDPATEIAACAERLKAGLVVIPSHGYDGIRRLLLGSVAEGVVRDVACPVLVLRRMDAE